MLRLRLTPYSENPAWTWSGACYGTFDQHSRIEPFDHPMLEHLGATDGRRTLIIVRERVANRPACDPEVRTLTPGEYDQARESVTEWPTDFVLLETEPAQPARITAGSARTTPLYLADDGRSLFGSWDMADLRDHVTGINPREAARLLIYRPRYSSDTLFRGVHRLTERAVAHFGGSLWISYPEPALHRQPRQLAADADVLGAFVDTMDTAMDRRPWVEETTLFHLTGGFDSGTVATRAAERHPGLLPTATLLIGGPGRKQQIRRRAEMRSQAKFADTDIVIDAMKHPPLAPGCRWVGGDVISPTEDPLHYPFVQMARSLSAAGARTVVTGLGGDEMVALTPEEEPHLGLGEITDAQILPWVGRRAQAALEFADDGIAPPARVNSMTLLSLESNAPVLLRHGLWPVHPFADPVMVELGEQLPFAWRELKQVQRQRLRAIGMGEDVVHPVERESFAEVIEHSLITHAPALFARMLTEGSPLFDEGLVDPDGLRTAVEHLTSARYREEQDSKLLEVLSLHMSATAFLNS
ncbi:asparagine synthase-related protein [Nocardiopsis metallicus]|uniref:Asparagine synthase (Glutamine-hydrolyzing) n=1 Tax=Nocardiopsis metallicus TaxID=179819 RepID=A0A840WHS7_9ACTN|nr:asparagine synthase-related protein [Nocardiopsis metallicus]MBB5491026.1 asparagine synthase (glutamine-hydrolyzing) [Nocardiopsis metallicus]